MHYLSCLFDHRCNPPKPHIAASYNSDTKDVQFYQLYQPDTKYPLYEAKANEEKIRELLNKEEVVLSDFHSYINAFDLDVHRQFEVYDVNLPREQPSGNLASAKKRLLVQISSLVEVSTKTWQQLLANSQLAYAFLEKNGYYHNGKKCHSTYGLTYTGRSKCLVNNIQGASADDSIHHIDDEMDTFVHFDWVAADFRVASIISKDKYLQDSFKTSDPYTALYEALDSDEITRDQCKIELFRSLYSMNYDSDILNFYPDFANWMKESAEKIEIEGCSYSLLDRRFALEEDRTLKSAFNAQIQGSVVHAMQNVFYRVFKMFPENLLAEIHDSLVLCCRQKDLKTIIPEVSSIMLFPLEDILDENPRFALKVSIGMEWKKWKLYKEYR